MRTFHIHPPSPPIRCGRAAQVARWFGLGAHHITAPAPGTTLRPPLPRDLVNLLPSPGGLLLIVGPSGSGKSTLLRELRASVLREGEWIDLETIDLPDRTIVDCFDPCPLRGTLALLSRVGLAEVWTWLRTPGELSEGQRWRFRLALALHRLHCSRRTTLCCDEFAAVLDRVTAMVVSRALRKAIVAPLRALVATSHEDVIEALQPDVVARCDFGSVEIDR